jgi:hypothetical protein
MIFIIGRPPLCHYFCKCELFTENIGSTALYLYTSLLFNPILTTMKNQSTESTDGNGKSEFMINVQKISYLKKSDSDYFENSV